MDDTQTPLTTRLGDGVRFAVALLLSAVHLTACGHSSAATRDDGTASGTVDGGALALTARESHEHDVGDGWVTAGQPSEARLREVVGLGARVISLRYASEDPGYDEPGVIEELGGTFIRYETSGADYDRLEFREGMYDLYDQQRELGGFVYLHCGSSNRAGASWALYQAERLGLDAEEAIAKGKQAGLASLEGRVRAILGVQ